MVQLDRQLDDELQSRSSPRRAPLTVVVDQPGLNIFTTWPSELDMSNISPFPVDILHPPGLTPRLNSQDSRTSRHENV